MRTIVVLLTIPVVALLAQPLWAPQWGIGILGEVAALGWVAGPMAVVIFFGLIALYVRSLQRLLVRVRVENRIRSPRSLWLMFAIPFNFVEDFFIVAETARSLRAEACLPARWLRVWQLVGLGWCGLQIVSLAPGEFGVAAGALALIGWVAHWVLTAWAIQRIARDSQLAAQQA